MNSIINEFNIFINIISTRNRLWIIPLLWIAFCYVFEFWLKSFIEQITTKNSETIVISIVNIILAEFEKFIFYIKYIGSFCLMVKIYFIERKFIAS